MSTVKRKNILELSFVLRGRKVMSTVKRKNILELSFVLRGRKVKVSSDILVKVCIAFANGIFFYFLFFYGNRFMQLQKSQEDSYIYKRANINLGPCTKTRQNTTQ